MFLAFVDESYNKDLFCLSALVADDLTTAHLSLELDGIIQFVNNCGFPGPQELHGHEIFHGSGSWKDVPLRLRMHAYFQAMKLIGQSGALAVFSDLVRVAEEDPSSPHERALTQLLERLEILAEDRSQYVLVLADEVHSAERHRTNFRFYQSGEDGHSGRRLTRILDTLYFGPSRHSRMLQAADLVTYMRLRRSTVPESNSKATRANDAIWALIEPILSEA